MEFADFYRQAQDGYRYRILFGPGFRSCVSSRGSSKEMEEVLIFITPHILKEKIKGGDDTVQSESKEAVK